MSEHKGYKTVGLWGSLAFNIAESVTKILHEKPLFKKRKTQNVDLWLLHLYIYMCGPQRERERGNKRERGKLARIN